MALAPNITYTVRDGDNDSATTSVYVPIGDTLARYTEFAIAHAPTIEGIILGVIDPNAVLSIPVDISALTGNTATATSDVEQLAAFQFANTDNEPINVNIPGRNELHVVTGTDVLDETEPVIAAMIAMMEDGIAVTGGTASPCDIAESDIVDTFYVRKLTKNSGRKR